jgi:hypothetical protein
MTHLLIPLESLKKEIENNRRYLDSVERRLRNSSWDKLDTATEVLENILTHKQISLDEEDIEAKAIEYLIRSNSSETLNHFEPKQALKDLL